MAALDYPMLRIKMLGKDLKYNAQKKRKAIPVTFHGGP
jgi:hypothetical protein